MGKKASKQSSISTNGEPPNEAKLSVRNSGDFGGPESTVSAGSSSILNGTKSLSGSSGTYQDSAINELLEGRMKLTVNILHRNEQLVISVERRTPLLDLLVQIATQFHFNASNYVIQVDEDERAPNACSREYKASTPIGLLDANKVSVVPKPEKKVPSKSVVVAKSSTFSRQQSAPVELPFKPTIRLQINLPHNQLMVVRLMPNTGLAEIKQMICNKKSLDSGKYLLMKPFKTGQTPLVLDLDKSLDFYHINEVTLLANKTYQELSKQFSSSNRNHFTSSMYDEGSNRLGEQVVDLSQSTPNIAKLNGTYKRSASESQSDLNSLKRTDSAVRTGRSFKSKPAPPPPLKSAKSMQNLAPIRDEEEERSASEVYSSYEHHDTSSLSEHSTTIDGSKQPPEGVVTVQPSKHRQLSRQNSGSDSSGYHEMLSHTEADTPTDSNSPAPPLSLSPNPSETCSLVSNKPPPVPSQRTSLSSKPSLSKAPAPKPPGSVTSTASKQKRRAPLPPSAVVASNQSDEKQTAELPQRIIESPEPNSLFMSSEEVASTASGASTASSAFDESKMSWLNNQSLSPIVIIKSSATEANNESIDEMPIDEVAKPTMNSTMIPQAEAQVPEPKSENIGVFIESEPVETDPSKPIETTSIEPANKPGETSPGIEPVAQPKPEHESYQSTEQFFEPTGELELEHDHSASEQCTINGTMNQHHSGTPVCGGDVTVQVQPMQRLSTLGRDRAKESSSDEAVALQPAVQRTSLTQDSYRVLSEQVLDGVEEPEDQHVLHFHEHEEGSVCACEHFTSKYNRIRSQFSHFEAAEKSSIAPEETETVLAKSENSLELVPHDEESCKEIETKFAEESSIRKTSSFEANRVNDSLLLKQQVDAFEEVNAEVAVEDQDDEMNGSLKRPSVVTISEWKTAPKDNELLLGSNRNSSVASSKDTVSRSHSSVDRNLEKQVEVTLNELNDTLDDLDCSEPLTPPSIRKKVVSPVFTNTTAVVFSNPNRITVEDGKSKINIVSNSCDESTKFSKEADNGRTKVSIGSMKGLPSADKSVNTSPTVSTSPMKSVRDNIAKFSAASNNSNLNTSRANYSVSHQDLSSLHRSLPTTPSGTLSCRSSSKVTQVAGSNSAIPEIESPQVMRKLANFRIGSFKKELDIYEHQPMSKQKVLKPIIVTNGSWKATPFSTNLMNINKTNGNTPSQPNGGISKPSPTVITVNGNGAMSTHDTTGSALPKESAKKVFNASTTTNGAANPNGGRTFLQELKSRTWSHRTGLSPFDEEEMDAAGATDKADSFTKPSANSNSRQLNVARQQDLYNAKQQQSASVISNGIVNKAIVNSHQSDHKPLSAKVISNSVSPPPPPPLPPSSSVSNQYAANIPPPPPPPPSMASIDATLANRTLSPELQQTNTLLAPKGWKSVKVTEQPKQIRSPLRSNSLNPDPKSPASSLDQHDALLNEIRNFQNKNKLKKVANNEPFTLAVNSNSR